MLRELCAAGFLLVTMMAAMARDAQAREVAWTGLQDDFWDINANWIDDELPPQMLQPFVGDNAIIPVLSTPTVRFLEQINNLTNAGTIQVNSTLEMRGDNVDNDGTINVGDGTDQVSSLLFSNPFTNELDPMLTGNGEIVLNRGDPSPLSGSSLRGGAFADDPVTHADTHTIRGEGFFGGNWINEGLIRAEETTGDSSATLEFDAATVLNRGEIRSSPTAPLNMARGSVVTGGAGGLIIADTQPIILTSVTIVDATLEATGGGIYEVADDNGGPVLSGVTVNALIDNTNAVGNSTIRSSAAGLTNNSTITLDGQGSALSSFGFVEPGGTLDGSGEIFLKGGTNGTFIAVFPGISHEFTHGVNHAIRGAGAITTSIINNGTIRAEPGTNGATLQISGVQTNNNRMEAGAGATLLFTSTTAGAANVTQAPGGVIVALDGGTVTLNGGFYAGGSFDTAGSGEFTLTSNPTLTDMTNLGTFNVPGGRTVAIAGSALTNNGTITLNSNNGNSISMLSYSNDITLDGTGEVVLNTPSSITSNGGVTLTHGANHAIRGAGLLNGGDVVNQGTIAGNSDAEPIIFGRGFGFPGPSLSGAGTLKNVQIGVVNLQRGVHAPGGASPGDQMAVVSLEESYTITSRGTLAIELGGTTPGSGHDQLSSTGTINLGGLIDVSMVDLGNGYTPTAGDMFEIITSANNDIVGTFNFDNLPQFGLSHFLEWEPIDYSDPRKVVLEIASAAPYDVNLDDDGDVDGADFLAIQRTDPSLIPAWEFEYGRGTPPLTAASQAVPEPGASWLVFIGTMAYFQTRKGPSRALSSHSLWQKRLLRSSTTYTVLF